MDWPWHVVFFLFVWFVLADTFYRHYSIWLSFGATFLWYPLFFIAAQVLQGG